MPTLEEILEGAGLDEEARTKVLTGMAENKIYTASEENLDIRYKKAKTDLDATKLELETANATIEGLKNEKGAAAEEVQKRIADYEEKIKNLQGEKEKAETKSALQIALAQAGAKDVDYAMYKIGEVKLDGEGKIEGWTEALDKFKSEHPDQFGPQAKPAVEPNKLAGGEGAGQTVTREAFKKMTVAERVKLRREDPETYESLK